MRGLLRRPVVRWLATAPAVLALGIVAGLPQAARAISPDDPAIQAAVEKGIKFLTESRHTEPDADMRLGAECLIAVALYKCKVDASHPIIKHAADEFRAKVKNGGLTTGYHAVYNLGVGIVLMAALKDKDTTQAALRQLLAYQRSNGGFATLPGNVGGDTSMTQYAVLGMWEATRLGIAVPAGAWQGAANWLLQTQLESGIFVYAPPNNNVPIEAQSMTAAGVSSLYICASRARMRPAPTTDPKTPGGKKSGSDTPSALTPVGGKKEAVKEKESPITPIALDMARMEAAMKKSDDFISKDLRLPLQNWTYYYLYAMERYYAFRERYRGEEDFRWYNQGAEFLIKRQSPAGNWPAQGNSEEISTAFALLFLIQNTRTNLKTVVEDKATGILLSGSGLPSDLTNLRLKGGELVVKPLAGPAGELLEIMDKPDDPQFLEAVEGFAELIVKADDTMLSPHLVRLRKMSKSSSPDVRAAVIAALGKARNLDDVPTLIYALKDDDPVVLRAAWDALRFVSRRFDAFGTSPDPKGNDRERALAKATMIERWQQWYRTIRPDAQFDD